MNAPCKACREGRHGDCVDRNWPYEDTHPLMCACPNVAAHQQSEDK